MNWITYFASLLLITTTTATRSELNEITPTDSSQKNGATQLRRLVIPIELTESSPASSASSENNNVENVTSKDEILEESTVRDKMSVHFYSANVDTEANTESDLLKYLLEKVGSPANNGSKVIIKYTPTERSTNDNELNSSNDIPAISSKRDSEKSSKSKDSKESSDEVEKEKTTAKPAETHNSDGENIEVVDKKDIKIFQAPLVSAFTVHQDDVGLPKKVVPLIPPFIQPTPIPVVQLSSISFPERLPFVQSNLVTPSPIPTQIVPFQLPVPSFLQPEALQKHYQDMRGNFQVQGSHIQNSFSTTIPQQIQQPARDLLPPLNGFQGLALQQFPQHNPILNSFDALQAQPLSLQNQQQVNFQQVLLERQKYLEEQIIFLQNQARQQQQQILLQQQLLQDSRRKRFENQSGVPNQLIPSQNTVGKSKLSNEIQAITLKPQLEIFKSVTQSPRYEISTQQHLPVRDAVPFHSGQGFTHQQQKATNVEFQQSTQLNFNDQQKNVPAPLELSSALQLPQKNFQPFRSNNNQNQAANPEQQISQINAAQAQLANQQIIQQQVLLQHQQQQTLIQQQQLEKQKQQQQQQRQLQLDQLQRIQQHEQLQQQILQQQQFQQLTARNRNFRSEPQTGNHGFNLVSQSQPRFTSQQSFASQTSPADIQLQSLLYQSALNHGINPHVPHNIQLHWPFGSF